MDNPGLCVSGGEVKVGSRARLMLAQFPLEKENTIYWFQGNDMCSQPCFPVLLLIRPGPSFSRVWTPSAFWKRPCQLLLQEVLNHESMVRGKICLLCLRGTGPWFNWVWLPSLLAEFVSQAERSSFCSPTLAGTLQGISLHFTYSFSVEQTQMLM